MSRLGMSVFGDFVNVFSSYMAPGNLKCNFMAKSENKSTSNQLVSRKNNVRNNSLNSDMANKPNHHVSDAMGINNNTASEPKTLGLGLPMMEAGVDGRIRFDDVANCGDASESKLDSQVTHLKGLLMLHLDLIQQQQKDLQQKEKEVKKLRDEKETLLCRLQRMERRMSLASKSAPIKNKNYPTTQTTPVTPIKTETLSKRKATSTPHTSKKTLLDTIDTKTYRCGSPSKITKDGSSTPAKRRYRRFKKYKELGEDKFHRTKVLYPSFRDLRIRDEEDDDLPVDSAYVIVPTWRVSHLNTSSDDSNSSEIEKTDDHTVEMRHQKMEMDEKKRKKWDVQRIRQIREHERLEMKQLEREIAHREDVIETFEPDIDDMLRIEVCDTIPVSAFGMLVPTISESEFSLPWYTPEPKGEDQQQRRTRSRAIRK
ncbi:male-specific lethal 1-like 1 [Antedon mediterranea]|uniref:male-specific lethal 1-like 1 n=1 Tax=Antedon mediterranea TaxID=105859 RepID=UPI003AF890B2